MSIIIPNITKAEHCTECALYKEETGKCILMPGHQAETYEEMYEDCPVIDLPKHGDLIDADAFAENMDFICGADGWLNPVTNAVNEYVNYSRPIKGRSLKHSFG